MTMGALDKRRKLLLEIGQNEEALEKTSLQLKERESQLLETDRIFRRGNGLFQEISQSWKGERANRFLDQSFHHYRELSKQIQGEFHDHKEELLEKRRQLSKQTELLQKAYAELKTREQ